MQGINWERWGAATGYIVFALGIAAAAFERGAPPANAPAEQTLAFLTRYQAELRAQSLLFVLSAGVYVWFFGSLRGFLRRGEGAADRLSTVVFGAGVVWAGLQMVFQSAQVALAMSARDGLEPGVAALVSDLAYALSVIAYVPMAVLLAAVTVVTLRTGVFPAWVAWLSAAYAVLNVVMAFGLVVDGGPLAPGAPLTYVLYALSALWQLVVTTVMVRRLGRPATAKAAAAS